MAIKTGARDSKACAACKRMQVLSQFPRDSTRSDSRAPYCRPCRSARAKRERMARRVAAGLSPIGKRGRKRKRFYDGKRADCRICHEVKVLSEFSPATGGSVPVQPTCKTCFRIYRRARRARGLDLRKKA